MVVGGCIVGSLVPFDKPVERLVGTNGREGSVGE